MHACCVGCVCDLEKAAEQEDLRFTQFAMREVVGPKLKHVLLKERRPLGRLPVSNGMNARLKATSAKSFLESCWVRLFRGRSGHRQRQVNRGWTTGFGNCQVKALHEA